MPGSMPVSVSVNQNCHFLLVYKRTTGRMWSVLKGDPCGSYSSPFKCTLFLFVLKSATPERGIFWSLARVGDFRKHLGLPRLAVCVAFAIHCAVYCARADCSEPVSIWSVLTCTSLNGICIASTPLQTGTVFPSEKRIKTSLVEKPMHLVHLNWTWYQARLPAELKHIIKRRKRN